MKKNKMVQSDVILTWNEQFENVLENIKKGKHIIILGGGGVGKSFLIKQVKDKIKMIYTASTGTAAVNINGCTIDSLLKLNQNKKNVRQPQGFFALFDEHFLF